MVFYSILQYITVYYSILQYITVYYSILQYIIVYYSILHRLCVLSLCIRYSYSRSEDGGLFDALSSHSIPGNDNSKYYDL